MTLLRWTIFVVFAYAKQKVLNKMAAKTEPQNSVKSVKKKPPNVNVFLLKSFLDYHRSGVIKKVAFFLWYKHFINFIN